jgi:hypothetical protein
MGTTSKTVSIRQSECDLGLAIWIRMLVHPESAIRGKDNLDDDTDERADTDAGRDTG